MPREGVGTVDYADSIEHVDVDEEWGADRVQPVLVLARNTYVLRDQVEPEMRRLGVLYEWGGRSIRFEQRKLLSTGAANPSWSPLVRLGFWLSVTAFGNAAAAADVPDAQLSASFGAFASTDAGPSMNIPSVADNVSGGALIRLIGTASTADKFYLVNLMIAEDKDEGLSPHGSA